MKMILKEKNIVLCFGLNSSEMRCKCESPTCRTTLVLKKLLNSYVDFRTRIGLPLRINSGYRCQLHNLSVGGMPKSKHIIGGALDINLTNVLSRYNITEIIEISKICGFKFMKYYKDENFIHIDVIDRSRNNGHRL